MGFEEDEEEEEEEEEEAEEEEKKKKRRRKEEEKKKKGKKKRRSLSSLQTCGFATKKIYLFYKIMKGFGATSKLQMFSFCVNKFTSIQITLKAVH